jgi:hypothetical protein
MVILLAIPGFLPAKLTCRLLRVQRRYETSDFLISEETRLAL